MRKNGKLRGNTAQRMSPEDRKRLASVVAALHYSKERVTQADIARRLGLSRMQVNRLLEFAHQMGLVGITPVYAPRSNSLEADLYRLLPKLKRVVVSWTDPRLTEEQKTEFVAYSAADFWHAYIRPTGKINLRIALGGGRTIAKLVDFVVFDDMGTGIDVLAISNIPQGDWETSANTNLAVLKRRFREVNIEPLLAMQLSPEMTKDDIAKERNRILNLQCVQKHFERALEVSAVFTGVGSLKDERLLKILKVLRLEESELGQTAVGDLSYNLINHDESVFHDDCPLSRRLITVPVDTLKQIAETPGKFVVVVAWGKKKAAPALDAYRAEAYNTLIVDEEMAEEMVRLVDKSYLSVKSCGIEN